MTLALKTKPTHNPHYKKRVGQHHRQTKQYSKTYWPYLPMLAIIVFGLLLNTIWSMQSHRVLGASTSINTTSLLSDTNQARAVHQDGALRLNSDLTQAAQTKAEDMAARNYWSHTTPDGKQPWTLIQASGYAYRAAGENLAYGFASSSQAVTAWMHSPEHRTNLLNSAYQDVGFGMASAHNYQGHGPSTIIVAMYAAPVSSANAAQDATEAIAPSSGQVLPAHTVARLQLLTGGDGWSVGLLLLVTVACCSLVIARHSLYWRRVVVRSEEFIIHHHGLDILLLLAGVASFVLTRTAGAIH